WRLVLRSKWMEAIPRRGSMSYPRITDGEVISFSRGNILGAVGYALAALGSGVWGLYWLWFSREVPGWWVVMPLIFGVLLIIGAIISIRSCVHLLRHQPRLVLGHERMRWVLGHHAAWEISYLNLGRIATFQGPWYARPRVGIELLQPELFDQTWPWMRSTRERWKRQFGYDLVLPTQHCSEPPERVAEAILTCMHRFRASLAERFG